MCSLFPEVDVLKTKKASRQVLSSYRRLARLADVGHSLSITSKWKDAPRSTYTVSSPIEQEVIRRVDAERAVEAILYACQRLTQLSYEVLYLKYLQKEKWTNTQIQLYMQDRMNQAFSERDFARKLADGLLEFAEAYRGGCLLVFENK